MGERSQLERPSFPGQGADGKSGAQSMLRTFRSFISRACQAEGPRGAQRGPEAHSRQPGLMKGIGDDLLHPVVRGENPCEVIELSDGDRQCLLYLLPWSRTRAGALHGEMGKLTECSQRFLDGQLLF
jgi:hypothetical protein